MSGRIDDETAPLQCGFGRTQGFAPSQKGADARNQLAHAERFGHIVVSTHFQPNHSIRFFIAGGQHQ